MAENQVDGGSDNGTATEANGGASETQSVQQPSFDAAKLQETLDALTSKITELEARTNGLQRQKDKKISSLKAQIAEYKELEKRLGPEGAMEQIELKQTLAQMNQTLEQLQKGSVSTQSLGTGVSGAVDAAQVINVDELGWDKNDPQVALLAQKNFSSAAERDAAIVNHLKAKKSAPSPTAAQAPAETGAPPPPKDLDERTNEYIKNVRAAFGKPGEIKHLREKAIQDGVKVWEIDFT